LCVLLLVGHRPPSRTPGVSTELNLAQKNLRGSKKSWALTRRSILSWMTTCLIMPARSQTAAQLIVKSGMSHTSLGAYIIHSAPNFMIDLCPENYQQTLIVLSQLSRPQMAIWPPVLPRVKYSTLSPM